MKLERALSVKRKPPLNRLKEAKQKRSAKKAFFLKKKILLWFSEVLSEIFTN